MHCASSDIRAPVAARAMVDREDLLDQQSRFWFLANHTLENAEGWTPFVDPAILNLNQCILLTFFYGYLLFQASNLISDGSELLLLVPHIAPIVGSVVLPVLGAVPDGLMVFFSGMGERSEAQDQINVGVGTLAGSTIMLLTCPWFVAVVCGRVNMKKGMPVYKRPASESPDTWEKLTPAGNLSLLGTGVGIGDEVRSNAVIMVVTLLGYLIIQLPMLFKIDFEGPLQGIWSLLGLIFCAIAFLVYLVKQWRDTHGEDGSKVANDIADVTVKAIQDGKMTLLGAMAKLREDKMSTVLKGQGLDEALCNNSSLTEVRRMCKVLAPFFRLYDYDGDNYINFEEFRMLFRDVRVDLSRENLLQAFSQADSNSSGYISFPEFVACLMTVALDSGNDDVLVHKGPRRRSVQSIDVYLQAYNEAAQAKDEEAAEEEDAEEEEDMPPDLCDLEPEEQQRRIKYRALLKASAGTLMLLVFSDPMVDIMDELGHRFDIPSFFVAFVLAPIASNASELLSSYVLASRRTLKHMTSAMQTLEGAACMNNTYCLGILLGLVYFRKLDWNFQAETFSIILIELIMFCLVYWRKAQTLLEGILVLSLYPLSLVVVATLQRMEAE